MCSLPFLEDWNKGSALAVGAGLLLGFVSGLFALSVPFEHSFSFGQYRIAIAFSALFLMLGFLFADRRVKSLVSVYEEELKDPTIVKFVRKRIYSSYFTTYFLTFAVAFFSWFLLRTQLQWTNTVLMMMQAVVYFLYCIFAYLSVRDANAAIVSKYHHQMSN